jgi:hypothetical protein
LEGENGNSKGNSIRIQRPSGREDDAAGAGGRRRAGTGRDDVGVGDRRSIRRLRQRDGDRRPGRPGRLGRLGRLGEPGPGRRPAGGVQVRHLLSAYPVEQRVQHRRQLRVAWRPAGHGDWNGDGRDGLGVVRTVPGISAAKFWYLRNTVDTASSLTSFRFGAGSDIPTVWTIRIS